ncbi:hypothetical protein O0I10_004002 [Lichtheimia ornata]|uniref:ENTH domain-containing protein n=1 Tax=Lichtheimia ornata TaxID=688661 RepID=A0AAD7Y0Q7_9FUNG|nr:uncharacterized protein O0I10_004002 [Lichtheimia ornata]KAJ8660143.1 hypothetical protein O0I10_004002 [Lichtheimia ornata]
MNSFSQLNLQIPDMWEVKDVINKVKNVVLNYTEMEAKVHEATNNEAWGASSTLMQEIAQGTYNYQYFNEIMPTLYKRFTEKEARQWRQIYKALVLLEYLVKNGSERVIDDARSHISMIKIMRNFHYIDEKGKDQGINIRNRAKEIVELLNDTDKIRSERKKARQNRNKYQGVGSDSIGGMGMMSGGGIGGGGSRYGGFGSDGLSSGSLGFSSITGIGGGSGSGSGYYDEDERPNRFESSKYDDFDDEPSNISSSPSRSSPVSKQESKAPAKKEANLFDFDDAPSGSKATQDDDWGDFASGAPAASGSTGNVLDDFDDFQSAPPVSAAATTTATPNKPTVKSTNDLFDLLGNDAFSSPSTPNSTTTTPAAAPMSQAPLVQPAAPSLNMNQARPLSPSTTGSSRPGSVQGLASPASANAQPTTTKPQAELPGGIWSQASSFVSLDSLGKTTGPAKPAVGPSMNAMKNSSVNAGWNAWANSNTLAPATPSNNNNNNNMGGNSQQQKTSSPFDDLLS